MYLMHTRFVRAGPSHQVTNEMSEMLWASAVAVSGVRMKTALIECEADVIYNKIKVNLVW